MRSAFLAVAGLALAAPAQAQPATDVAGPDEDLRCATWAAVALGLNKDNPEVAPGYGMALAWFVARYEGATGKPFEKAMTFEYVETLAPQLEAIEQVCKPRVAVMSERFTSWGSKLQSSGE